MVGRSTTDEFRALLLPPLARALCCTTANVRQHVHPHEPALPSRLFLAALGYALPSLSSKSDKLP